MHSPQKTAAPLKIGRWLRAIAIASLATVGCRVALDLPEGTTVRCTQGGGCPSDLVCVDELGVCMAPGSSCIEEKNGRYVPASDGNLCNAADQAGVCRSGACIAASCGDTIVQLDSEQCDDGNANDNDGCGQCQRTVWTPTVALGLGPGGRALTDASFNDLRVLSAASGGRVYAGYGRLRPPPVAPFGGPQPAFEDTYGGVLGVSIPAQSWFFVTGDREPLGSVAELSVARGVSLGLISGLAVDGRGQLFVATAQFTINATMLTNYQAYLLRIDAEGAMTIVTGGPERCDLAVDASCGDGALARYGSLRTPGGLAFDKRGRLHFVDGLRVRVIGSKDSPSNDRLSTRAGMGPACTAPQDACGDGANAVFASFIGPLFIAFDPSGRLVIADAGAHRIRVIEDSGIIVPYVGDGTPCATYPVCPLATPFASPTAIAFDDDALLVIDTAITPAALAEPLSSVSGNAFGDIVRRLSVDGAGAVVTSSPVLGTGVRCMQQPCGDGGPGMNADTGRLWDVTPLGQRRFALIDEADAPDAGGASVPSRVRVIDLATGVVDTFAGRTLPQKTVTGQLATSAAGGAGPLARADNGDIVFASSTQVFRIDAVTNTLQLVAGVASSCSAACAETGPSETFAFTNISSVAVRDPRVYVADGDQHRVFVVENGSVRPFFGSADACTLAVCPDVADPRTAQLKSIGTIAVDSQHLYATDALGDTVWEVTLPNGPARRLAGTGAHGLAGDGGDARSSVWRCPYGVAVADDGSVEVADVDNCRVRRIAGDRVDTALTNGACGSDVEVDGAPCGAWAAEAAAWVPFQLGRAGSSLYIATLEPSRVFESNGATLTHIVGADSSSLITSGALHEGVAATEIFLDPEQFVIGQSGKSRLGMAAKSGAPLLVGHSFGGGRLIRKLVDGRLFTAVGAIDEALTGDFAVAELFEPQQAAVLDATTRLVADSGHIRSIDVQRRRVETFFAAAAGEADLGPTPARFAAPEPVTSIAVASPASVYFATTVPSQLFAAVRAGDGSWSRTRVAFLADETGGSLFAAELAYAVDPATGPVLYASDPIRQVIYQVNPASGISTVAVGQLDVVGFSGEGAVPGSAQLDSPRGMAVSASNQLYFADTGNNRVRRLHTDDAGIVVVETVLGTGEGSSTGDGSPARSLPINAPRAIAFDEFGNLIVTAGSTVRIVYATGPTPEGEPSGDSVVETIFDAQRQAATSGGVISCLNAVFTGGVGEIYALDACSGAALRLTR